MTKTQRDRETERQGECACDLGLNYSSSGNEVLLFHHLISLTTYVMAQKRKRKRHLALCVRLIFTEEL